MTKQDFPRYLKLRRMHDGYYVTIPRDYVYAHDLSWRDDILWQPGEGRKITLEFLDREPSPAEASP
jgi:hypothetical protein